LKNKKIEMLMLGMLLFFSIAFNIKNNNNVGIRYLKPREDGPMFGVVLSKKYVPKTTQMLVIIKW
jgi:hypothetical protein